jgi:hypothetical protein
VVVDAVLVVDGSGASTVIGVMRQYSTEGNFDGRPFDRDIRSIVYERAKGTAAEEPFATERDVYQASYEYLVPSMAPRPVAEHPPHVRIRVRTAPGRTTWHCAASPRSASARCRPIPYWRIGGVPLASGW